MSSKQREAIAEMVEYAQAAACHSQDAHIDHYLSQIIAWGKKALNEPLRNCDIGTAEEQIRRIRSHCKQHRVEMRCIDCPVKGVFPKDCALIWAQMPYESEETK